MNSGRRNTQKRLCRERTYCSFISSLLKRRPACTCFKRFINASNSCAPPLCAVNCSSHSRNKAFNVLCRDFASRRACSISCSSALRVMFFIREQCTRLSCYGQLPFRKNEVARSIPVSSTKVPCNQYFWPFIRLSSCPRLFNSYQIATAPRHHS